MPRAVYLLYNNKLIIQMFSQKKIIIHITHIVFGEMT